MEFPRRRTLMERLSFSFLLLHTTLFFSYIQSQSETFTVTNNVTDRLALISFKDGITDNSLTALRSWNDSLHFCHWQGITCGRRHQRVTALTLRQLKLKGAVSPYIGNLTFLQRLDLRANSFHGEIPQEIGRLYRLQFLLMTENSFTGRIPSSLIHCADLRVIDLGSNNLVGTIPAELGSLSKLFHLSLGINNLTGSIPPSLGNLSSLNVFALLRNDLEGSIPDDLCRITALTFFQVSVNRLSGKVPSCLYNISSIETISVAVNQFHGSLPPDIGFNLPNLQELLVGGNQFTGRIPNSFSNASGLVRLDLSGNNFTGGIPANLGSLKGLLEINVGENQLGTGEPDNLSFLTSLINCTNLEKLAIVENGFSGELPNSIGNLSTHLILFIMGGNQISGRIPTEIGNLVNLTALDMVSNFFTGDIPSSMGKLQNLQYLSLARNRLSGQIPSSLGNISQLNRLYLRENSLHGSIPSSLGDCRSLQLMDLSFNNLSGTIPKEVIGLSSLSIFLKLGSNSLTGSLPLEVGNLKNIRGLQLSDNKLSGEIPGALGKCESLEFLELQNNFFQGAIPPALSNLKGTVLMDLSSNNLSGQIPDYLGKFQALRYLNLSFNNLDGEVPKEGVFRSAKQVYVLGNSKLCGGIANLHLPTCLAKASRKCKSHLKVIIPVVSTILFAVLLSCLISALCWMRKSRKQSSTTSTEEDSHMKISYTKLHKATEGFSLGNLIGVGSYGSVYKGILHDDERVIAVKVLNLQQKGVSKSFLAECKALRNIRHRNLVKIITSCSSLDYKGNDFKALVFEFVPNGSLEKWLHLKSDGQHQVRNLSLIQRLNIAIDVASALDYLHHDCQTPIAHCDLKPSNVLLDESMSAHVGDFGLARFLSETATHFSKNETRSVAIKGSIGYVAPEYGLGSDVSTCGDVYSYGILLLEIFTGRRPTGDMFKDGLSLHEFAKMALPDRVLEIADPRLLEEEEEEEEEEEANDGRAFNNAQCREDKRNQVLECLVSVIRTGVACSVESPKERMQMRDVVMEMHVIRDTFLGAGVHRER